MLPPLIDKSQPSPADRWLWALLGVLVVGQLVALWLVCRQQVERQTVREAQARAERVAMMDVCAPKNGRATCAPPDFEAKRAAELNAVMAAMR